MSEPSTDRDELVAALGEGYELLDRLGQGAHGTVYKALSKRTGQTVAIKVQRLGADQTDEQRAARVARFERETKLCATLNHPNIVRIIDMGRAEHGLYMVFEHVPGETLTALLARRRALPAAEAVGLMVQMLDALETAHAQGIVHRDLKPDNVMVVPAGGQPYVKVLDFGIGAYVTDAAAGQPALTRSHEILGTPCYSAPEQLRGEPATPRSDLYAWGLVLLECLTGRRVMDGATMAQVFHKQLSAEEVPLPPALLLHPLGDLLRRVLAKHPRERASDAGRLARELRALRVSDLVGPLEQESQLRPAPTLAAEGAPFSGEQRQATVLCCSLDVVSACANPPDLETFDAIQRDQLSACADIIARFGGHVVGRLADRIIAVFGVPRASDSDARRACRTALELSLRTRSRAAILASQRGVDLELRVGVHTGLVLVGPDGTPGGAAFNLAARLEGMAAAGATLVSEATRNLLARQFGFQALEHASVRGAPAAQKAFLLVSEGPGADPLIEPDRSALVGRKGELSALLGHWTEARAGRGRAVVLRGEAGVGKSRLAQEARQRALADGATCHEIRCFPEDSNSALCPVLTFLRQQLELASPQPEARTAQLERTLLASGLDPGPTLPVLAAWLDLPAAGPPLQISGERQREILLEALVRVLATTGPDEPRFVLIEDLHWADPTTHQLVSRLARLAPDAGVLVLLTARSELTVHPDPAHAIELHGLDRDAVAQLVALNLGGTSLDPEGVAGIVDRADGIPLYVEELTRGLVGTGRAFARAEGRPGGDIPASLQDLLTGRLDRLGPARETAQEAAAIGREFELGLLDAVSARDRETLQAHLDALVEARMVRPRLQAGGTRYEFRHALIQEAAWESLLAAQRRSVHGRIARALEQRAPGGGSPEWARLARHHELAGAAEEAIRCRLQAGQDAARASALEEARLHLRAGLGLLASVADVDRRNALEVDLRTTLGGVVISTHGLGAGPVLENFTRTFELVRAGTAVPIQRFRALRGLWTFHNARADYATAGDIIGRMLELAAAQGGSELHLLAHECAGQTALLTGHFQAAVDHSQQCERWFDPALQREQIMRYATDPRLNARSFECLALALLGQVDGVEQAMGSILGEVDRLGVPGLRALMLGQAAWIDLLWSGCLPRPNPVRARALALGQEAERLTREIGFLFGQAYAGLLVATAGALDGRAEGVAALEQTIAMWRMSGTQALLSWQLAFLASGKLARRDHAGALAAAEAAVEHCERTGEAYGASEAQRALGSVLGDREGPVFQPERAVAAWERALAIARAQQARWLALRAAFSFARHAPPGAADRARARLREELGWFQAQRQGLSLPLVRDCLELLG